MAGRLEAMGDRWEPMVRRLEAMGDRWEPTVRRLEAMGDRWETMVSQLEAVGGRVLLPAGTGVPEGGLRVGMSSIDLEGPLRGPEGRRCGIGPGGASLVGPGKRPVSRDDGLPSSDRFEHDAVPVPVHREPALVGAGGAPGEHVLESISP